MFETPRNYTFDIVRFRQHFVDFSEIVLSTTVNFAKQEKNCDKLYNNFNRKIKIISVLLIFI